MASSMDEILTAREERWQSRCQLASRYNLPVVSLTLNIPGGHKGRPEYRVIYREILDELLYTLGIQAALPIVHLGEKTGADGPEALLVVQGEGLRLKQWTVQVEQSHPLGRLVDIDVMTGDQSAISRSSLQLPARECLICEGLARECITARKHSTQAVLAVINGMVADYIGRREAIWPTC